MCWYWFPPIVFAGMHWFYWKFVKGYIICKMQVSFKIGNHLQNFFQVMALFRLSFCPWGKTQVKILFSLNNFWRDALISFKVCRMVYHYSIEVKFDFGNHPKQFWSNYSPLFTWSIKYRQSSEEFVCLCWGFTAQSTQWGHVERGQFTKPHVYWAGLVL